MSWVKNCPKCNREILYKSSSGFKSGIKNNTECKSCITNRRSLTFKRKCITCHQNFNVQYYRRNISKYCGYDCRKKTILKICPTCNTKFNTIPSINQTYCKATCKRHTEETKLNLRNISLKQFKNGMSDDHKRAISEAQKGKPVWNQGTATIKQCKHCGNDYKAIGIRKETGLYCSLNCRSEYAYQNRDIIKRKYYLKVWKVTMQQPLDTLKNFDKRGKSKKGTNNYQIDHIIPISDGYKTNLLPEIVGNIKNLRMLHWRENIKRYHKEKHESVS